MTGADVMGPLAERYVRLVLAVGQHDADFVDAYYGPPEWKPDAAEDPRSKADLERVADRLIRDLEATAVPAAPLERLRRDYLIAQSRATRTRLRMLGGARLTFDEESQRLYDAVAPTHDEAYFDGALKALDGLVPGDGPLASRVEAFRQRFVIPPDKLDAVFRAAVDACRAADRRAPHAAAGEQFTIEYVTGKSWSGYNWYQGNYRSLIQVNTDLPIFIDRALDLACHEGYPGHHVYNVLLEHHLVRGRGWQEFTVYPLFSPQSLIAEGTANFGIDVAYPASERVAFERDAPVPACGARPGGRAEVLRGPRRARPPGLRRQRSGAALSERRHQRIAGRRLPRDLHPHVPPARRATRAVLRSVPQLRHQLQPGQGPRARLRRALGRLADKPDARWKIFGELLSSPRLPSGL